MTRRETLMQRRTERRNHTEEIDIGLKVLCAAQPDEPMALNEIAAYCNCSPERIGQIEKIALKKLQRYRDDLLPYFSECA